jgi:hypothetical protein
MLVGMFLLLTTLFRGLSGWGRLAELYRTDVPPAEGTFRRQTVRVGPVRFRRSMSVGVSAAGLYLAPSWPFVRQHPPVLIPWEAVSRVDETSFYWRTYKNLHIGEPEITAVAVESSVYAAMQPHLRHLS